MQNNVAILHHLGLNFWNFFLNFFTNCPWLTNTVKGCKKVVSFYSGKLSEAIFKSKKCFWSSSWFSYTIIFWWFGPEPSRNSPALEFRLQIFLKIIHWIKRNNLFTTFYSVCESRTISKKFKKKFQKFNPGWCKIATLFCKKNYHNISSRTNFIKA